MRLVELRFVDISQGVASGRIRNYYDVSRIFLMLLKRRYSGIV